ncbi:Txe/YoeB family addiction module toxin [Hydrogenimonas cancrithermarum]|uniref:Putative mRNA interferase YoeB n=1 Tax=Hydrogenimonas cancrithermarum TaxID=2993563 RepID=A0ABM8FM02_9BACT|nr:Txe/YoeB family addiction module toxin [Hydrogenimonas cancrithermarum]BDY12738.1 toxin YoeB [Hydrogenimonas cancrithermarum]
MIVAFSDIAWEDYLHWQQTNKKVLKRINLLIKDITRNPQDNHGLGKPEMLKGNLAGYFSRRITDEHRLVYKVDGDCLIVAQCRFHYV